MEPLRLCPKDNLNSRSLTVVEMHKKVDTYTLEDSYICECLSFRCDIKPYFSEIMCGALFVGRLKINGR